ncbi:DEAD/DEAH box helicase [uncultured Microbacterium sp.]|uniref:DEAD/DEAH box helicase n=1 Tax=uncultured Microbacterium sp. TaxID=191216 RepID=UPI00262B9F25|nr:DEAD/DEAH box helicase [uncultured Microbacterium sp.]
MPAPLVSDAEIRRVAGPGPYERGLDYARRGAVRRITWDDADATLRGVIAGSGSALYRCAIQLDVTGAAPRVMSARCSCPVGERCKHAVATLLRSNAGAGAGVHTDAGALAAMPAPAPRTPDWRSLLAREEPTGIVRPLALGVEVRLRESRESAHWGTRRVQTATPRALQEALARGRAEDISVSLRPLARSTGTGAWVRADVSWDIVRRSAHQASSHPYPRAQARWFAELHGIVHDARLLGGAARDDSAWLTLDSVESALFWPHLRGAEALGIPIVPAAKSQTVVIAEAGEVTVALDRGPAGGLTLSSVVTIGDATPDPGMVRPVGHIGVYSLEAGEPGVRLTLAPVLLGDAQHALLMARDRVEVPAADAAEFLREAYPRIARESDVIAGAGISLPAPEQTSAVMTVTFGPSATVRYALEWHRPGFGRAAFDTTDGSAGESELRVAIARTWTDRGLAFVAAATLADVDAAEFTEHVLPVLEAIDGVRVEVRGRRRVFRELTGDPRITVKTVESDDADWFDLGVLVEIDGHRIPFRPLFSALATGRKKLLLSDGHYFSVAHPALDRLRDLIAEAAELPEWESGPKISRYQLPLWDDFEDLADEAVPAVGWRAAVDAFRNADAHPVPAPAGLDAQLRPYQQEGFQRLALWWRHRLGGVLADDMGLGKTLQVLALMLHARETGERRPFLVVAPTSVLGTWRAEAARFAPGLRVHVAESTVAKSGVAPDAADADVVVTSYTLLRLDEDTYADARWAGVILDEAQFVKNPRTRLYRAVERLQSDMVLAVTGTPLENSLVELWALLALACPGLFPSARRFREEYVRPIEQGKVPENREGAPAREDRLRRLRARIRPFLLRRTKDLVAPELPARQEQELHVELSPAHRAIYDLALQCERRKVLGLLADLDRNRFTVFRSLTLLRRLALAPALVDAGDAGVRSSKFDSLRELLDELVAEGHRALVFSQFTSYLDLVRQDLDAHGIRYEYLDGSTRRRTEVVEAFRMGDAPVFLISLKAGGFGLTLTEADYVFLLDPWWNPAAEAQAVDRTHRIGQTRPVNVYRLIASGTIEEKVLALQQRKARLFQSVMGDDDLLARSLTAEDIRGLFDA